MTPFDGASVLVFGPRRFRATHVNHSALVVVIVDSTPTLNQPS